MVDVFVSYRADDAGFEATVVRRTLADRFGQDRVFLDGVSLAPGTAYPDGIRSALASAQVLVVLIGPRWLSAVDGAGRRRIDDARDWVRREVAQAVRQGTPVLPVLLDDARQPLHSELPRDIRTLAHRQSTRLRRHDLDADLARLVRSVERFVPADPPAPAATYSQHNEVHGHGTINASQGPGPMTVWGRP